MTSSIGVVLTLGDFGFTDMEVPDSIRFGVHQRIAKNRLLGGKPSFDVMGSEDKPLKWNGLFLGPDSLSRALQLKAMAKAGKPLKLTWSELSYSVVIEDFDAEFKRPYHIPYEIECAPVEDLANPLAQPAPAPLDAALDADYTTLGAFGADLAQPFSIPAIQVVRDTVAGLTSAANSIVALTSAIGGVVVGPAPSALAQTLIEQTAAMGVLPDLFDVDAAAARMQLNIETAGATGQTITLAGGDLYRAAVDAYGDVAGWATIAGANGLVDPGIVGVQSIRVPSVRTDNDGIIA